MKWITIISISLFLTGTCLADDEKDEKDKPAEAEASEQVHPAEELTGAEKKELEEQIARIVVEEHNATVDDEMDEVVCRNERVTGTRRKVRVCQTRREIEAEKAASQRLMRERNRRGSSPALATGAENR